MLKKIVNKRIEAFKEMYPDFHTTTKGNFAYRLNYRRIERHIEHHGFSVTKSTLGKIGTTSIIKMGIQDAIVVVCKTGKILIRHNNTRNFKLMTIKDVMEYPKFKSFFFIGRKFEYLRDYPMLWSSRFFQGFSSLKEVRHFLGFDFMADKDFYEFLWLIEEKSNKKSMESEPWEEERPNRQGFYGVDKLKLLAAADHKPNLVALTYNLKDDRDIMLLVDYVKMCLEHGKPCQIPRGRGKLEELHDTLALEISKDLLDESSDVTYYKSVPNKSVRFYEDIWRERGVSFHRVNTEREMLTIGISRRHCIGSYAKELHMRSFYTIYWKNIPYEIMLAPNATGFIQFYGRRNSAPPKELVDLVRVESFIHNIERIEEAFEKYPPKVEEPVEGFEPQGLLQLDVDLPF